MVTPSYSAIRNAVVRGNTARIYQELVFTPPESLVECWNRSVTALTNHGLPDGRRLETMLHAFMNSGMSVNGVDGRGCTPIMHAVRHKLIPVCVVLISAGADVNMNSALCTPTTHAFLHEDWDTVKLLQGHGGQLGGQQQHWDMNAFSAVLRSKDLKLFEYLLDQFEKNNKVVPWRDIMTACADQRLQNSAIVMVERDYMQEELTTSPSCPYLWCLRLAQSEGFHKLIECLVCKHPRLLYSGLSENSRTIRQYERDNAKKRYLTNTLYRCKMLDEYGPRWEVVIYKKVHQQPPSLHMLCRYIILRNIRTNAREKIQYLLLPQRLKSYLYESTSNTVLNLAPETREAASCMELPYALRKVVKLEPHPYACHCRPTSTPPSSQCVVLRQIQIRELTARELEEEQDRRNRQFMYQAVWRN